MSLSPKPKGSVRDAIDAVRNETERFLCDLIRYPSLPGAESDVMDYAARRFAEAGEVERVALQDAIREDPDYADPIRDLKYAGRSNVRVRVPGTGHGRSLLFNTQLDVVPASQGQVRPFDPRVETGVIRGRGACDAKGRAATLFCALLAMRRLNIAPRGDVLVHLVVEEEVGGNGTLAMVRHGEKASACIVMEPTELRVLSSVRGAVWFRVICQGQPGHSGSTGKTVSALKMAVKVMEILEDYQARLLAASRNIPLFDSFPNPMPITFGKLTAGNWPATAPAEATLEGVLGLLPNKTRFQVMDEMRQAITQSSDEWLRDNFKLEFMYRHDAHVLPPEHDLVTGLSAAARQAGGA